MNIVLSLWLTLWCLWIVESKNIKTKQAIIKVNEYFRNTGNSVNSLPAHIRWLSLLNIGIHNAINSLSPHFETYHFNYPNYISSQDDDDDNDNNNDNKIVCNEAAAVYGVLYSIKYAAITTDHQSNSNNLWFTTAQQQSKLLDLQTTIDSSLDLIGDRWQYIENGYEFGQKVGNDLLTLQSNDGWDNEVEPIYGTYPCTYIPGQWYTALFFDGVTYTGPNTNGNNCSCNCEPFPFTKNGALYPNWGSITTMGITSSSSIQVPARPGFDTDEFYQSYLETYNCGNLTSSTRSTLDENDVLAMVNASSSTFVTKIAQLIIEKNNNVLNAFDVGYIFAQLSLSLHDSAIHNTYWKNIHMADRPAQLIRWGDDGGVNSRYQSHTLSQWHFFRNGAPNQEYPAGHPENSGGGVEAIRLALVNLGIISETNDVIPNGPITLCEGIGSYANSCQYSMTITRFSEFQDRVIRARVCGGMHYRVSGEVGRDVGEQIAAYNSEHHLSKLSSYDPQMENDGVDQ
jgi:hypothetical protein